jgi:uncharacterized membrane protein YfcA
VAACFSWYSGIEVIISMTVLTLTCLLLVFAALAGCIGALTGLGGGLMLIPVLMLLGIPIHQAMGASLVASMTNSLVASIIFQRSKLTHVKLGMFLETATAIGAILGALFVTLLPTAMLLILLGCILLFSVYSSIRYTKLQPDNPQIPHLDMKRLSLFKAALSWFSMLIAGALSGLLGIGSGSLKVLAMDLALGLPYKVSASTSNFMIGMTATASIGIYLNHGFINPQVVSPVMLGAAFGSFVGAKVLTHAKPRILRILFNMIMFIFALHMLREGFGALIA